MFTPNARHRTLRRTVAAYTILAIGLAVSARLIFGGLMVQTESREREQVTVPSTMLTSLEPKRDSAATESTRPIESIRVGDRVLAKNPEIADQERAQWQEPNWENWLHLSLKMPLNDGDSDAHPLMLDIEILRPEQWFIENAGILVRGQEKLSNAMKRGTIEESSGTTGSAEVVFSPLRDSLRFITQLAADLSSQDLAVVALSLQLDLPEMGAVGTAFISEIRACPPIKPGAGHAVTATFSHPPANEVLDVWFEGESNAIGVTDNHLFWSADRLEYVEIGQMGVGERVVTYSGDTRRVTSKLARPGPQLVFNLEVYGEHVYYVGDQGLLVHNAYDKLNGQGLYVLRDKTGTIRYVGIGDVPSRLTRHAADTEWIKGFRKSDLTSQIIHDVGSLTKAQARGLEQALMGRFGGPLSRDGTGQLINKAVSYGQTNANRFRYKHAVTQDLWKQTLAAIRKGDS